LYLEIENFPFMSSSPSKQRNFDQLKRDIFDVVIVGGGISGAWLALHCSQQGYKTALIEQADYASQTSSASSKLLHSGIRYLQQMQFGRVRESAMERAHYLYAAAHLSASVPFAVPTYQDFARSKFFLNCGMLAYRSLCLGENSIISSKEQRLAPIESISSAQLAQICPISDKSNTGAVVFHERHMHDSERMVLAILQTAKQSGAVVFNHIRADHLIKENNTIKGIVANDQLSDDSFEVRSRVVVNAAGPWIDTLNASLDSSSSQQSITGFAVGSHIVSRKISDHAIAITTDLKSETKVDRGGRHVFIIPWRGHSLIGTSYNEVDNAELDNQIQTSHIVQLIEAINSALPEVNLRREDLISGYSGLYPLQTDNIQSKIYQGSGEYQIIDHSNCDEVEGIVTALGAKYTTGRKLSALTIPIIAKKLSKTMLPIGKVKLVSSNYDSLEKFTKEKIEQYKDKFEAELILHLITNYGSDIDAFIATLDDDLKQLICPSQPDILGQVNWAIEHEQAVCLSDILVGRTSLQLLGVSDQAIEKIAQFMAVKLDWSNVFLEQQLSLALRKQNHIQQCLDAAFDKMS